jgi:IMP dehydrogenase
MVSAVASRSEINTNVPFLGGKLLLPIVGSPMPDVTNWMMARELQHKGLIGILHRFQDVKEQAKFIWTSTNVGAAIGTSPEELERAAFLYEKNYIRIFAIDVANGFSEVVAKTIQRLRENFSDIKIIAGNVCTKEGYEFLAKAGADAIRVGIANGSKCATRNATGVFMPQFSALHECYEMRLKYPNTLLIADGAVKCAADFCKALVFADAVMLGSVLAATKESPAQTIKLEDGLYKIYRGAASFSVQDDFGKEPKYVEGFEGFVKYSGSLQRVIDKFSAGLRSSMSYFNARNLEEYRKNVTWEQI